MSVVPSVKSSNKVPDPSTKPSLHDIPVEIVVEIISRIALNDRLNFRKTSSKNRQITDHFLEHRVKIALQNNKSSTYLICFSREVFQATIFLHKIAFPQFLDVFLCNEKNLVIPSLHPCILSRLRSAVYIGDVGEVYELWMVKYLDLVSQLCSSDRHRLKFLLILCVIRLIINCPFTFLQRHFRCGNLLELEFDLVGAWIGSLWPIHERKSLNLSLLLTILVEIITSLRMNQSFKKVTNFRDCVAVFGVTFIDVDKRSPSKTLFTKFKFVINSKPEIIDCLESILKGKEIPESPEDYLNLPVDRLFLELQVQSAEGRKWGCSEYCIIEN